MSGEIVKSILSLNGDKSPSAIFLVGGGAHTPLFIEEISKRIGLPEQRIAIKDRAGIHNCICENNMGSAGVTVIGIALVGMRDDGSDFIDVYLNDEPISMFNAFRHTVADVLAAADIDPSMLIGKYGKNLKFTINGKSKIIFGQAGSNSVIKVNGELASIESVITAGDRIDVKYAVNGDNGHIELIELFEEFQCNSFYINGKLYTTDPLVIIDGIIIKDISNYKIKDTDNITIMYPKTVGEIKKYVARIKDDLCLNEHRVSEDYIIKEGDKFITGAILSEILEKRKAELELEESLKLSNDKTIKEVEITPEVIKEEIIEEQVIEVEIEEPREIKISKDMSFLEEIEAKTVFKKDIITITVNGKEVELDSNNVNLFFQVFNYVDVDLNNVNSLQSLLLNGEKASYTDVLKNGDIVEVLCN